MTEHDRPAEPTTFATLRPRLFSIACRMLGIRADAEDVVQNAWLRWNAADQAQLPEMGSSVSRGRRACVNDCGWLRDRIAALTFAEFAP